MYIKELESLRRLKNIKIDHLVNAIGVSRGTYYYWLNTDNMPINKLQPLLDILNEGKPIHNEALFIGTPEWMEVPYLSIGAQTAYLESLRQATELKLETMTIPIETEATNYLVIEVKGQAMNDGTARSIQEGDRLLCAEVVKDAWMTKLLYQQFLFVIAGQDGVVCKQITAHDVPEGIVTCHSWNSNYKDYQVHLDEVYKLFYVKKIVERKILF